MVVICILIFPFMLLGELMKMNNGRGSRRWKDLYISENYKDIFLGIEKREKGIFVTFGLKVVQITNRQ